MTSEVLWHSHTALSWLGQRFVVLYDIVCLASAVADIPERVYYGYAGHGTAATSS